MEMEREAEDPENNGHLVTCSDSDSSKELCVSPVQSHYRGSESDAEYSTDPQPTDISEGYPESPKCLPSQALSEQSGGQEDDSYHEMDNIHNIEPPAFNTVKTTLFSHSTRSDQEPSAGPVSRTQSASSPSSDGCGDVTPALTPTREHRQGDGRRQGLQTGARAKENWTLDSPEEGGCSEAPPAPISSGISSAGAEQAEKWNSESDTDPCRPERRRARRARHIVSESEKHIKETKSKCKRIALILTDAPNPQNKGALLFNKRRQRVKKFTLVSYGTHESSPDSEDQTEEDAEEVRSIGLNFVATSDSEPEEEYSVHPQEQHFDLNWEDCEEMEGLTDTTGKGVMMFAKRRQRMDEIALENEELRRKGLPVDGITPEYRDMNAYDTELYVQSTNQERQNYTDESIKQNFQYQEDIQQMNHLSNVPRPLVPNRTAKPFLGFQTRAPAPLQPPGGGITGPVTKKPELKFKVPVPINTSPQVWSPTGDIIASRDERISVPAVKRGTLPETKRRGTNKQSSGSLQVSDPYLQNKGDRRSYIEPEEDLFSLGAEACNFMQPRTVKLKNPPPVAPKPSINPKCPPWVMKKSPPPEPCHPTKSPLSPASPNPVVPHTHLQQQEGARPHLMANHWAPVNSAPQSQLQPTMTNRGPQPARSPVSIEVPSPTYSPSSPSRIKSSANSGLSAPPQLGDSHIHSLKPAPASPKGQASDRGISGAVDGPPLKGKGARLFAKRQSRMEKFVVDADTVQANKTPVRPPSPNSSLPNSWRYSPNVRAPPPNCYNPLLAPFYPPSAAKQLPSTSPKIRPKEIKQKPKAPPKHIDTLDVMRHQPYQLDSSLFKYNALAADKSPSPKSSTASISKVPPTPKPSSVHSKAKESIKSSGRVSSQYSSTLQHAKSAESLSVDKQLGEMPTANHISKNQAASAQPTYNQRPKTFEDSLASFTPASLIARGARQMAPLPKFSAKKPAVAGKLWKPVFLH